MFLSKAIFGTPSSSTKSAADVVAGYLGTLLQNGLICGETLHSMCGGVYTAYVQLARPDAALAKYHNDCALDKLRKIREEFGCDPEWEVLADNVPTEFHDFRTSSFLYLYPEVFGSEPPICCGDTGRRLPTYLIPLVEFLSSDLYLWSREYNHMDGIWLASGDLEIATYEQMASPYSQLAQKGRELARKVEQAMGVPTYYYLTRYYGRIEGEEKRRCPSCNGDWRIKEPVSLASETSPCCFRCEACRLVSNVGPEYDDEWAHIGEFDSKRQECQDESE